MTQLIPIRNNNKLDGVKKVTGTSTRPHYALVKILDGDAEHGIFWDGRRHWTYKLCPNIPSVHLPGFVCLWSFTATFTPSPLNEFYRDCNTALLLKLLFTALSKSKLVGYPDLMEQAFESTDASVSFLNTMTQLE